MRENIRSTPFWLGRLPLLISALYVIGSNLYYRSALPPALAVHFDAAGRPNGYMSWAGNLGLMLGILMLFTVIDSVAAKIWQAPGLIRKFNLLTVVCAFIAAAMAWANFCLLKFNLSPQPAAELSLSIGAVIAAAAIGYSIAAEYLRISRAGGLLSGPTAAQSVPRTGPALRGQARFFIQQRCNPAWWNLLLLFALAGLILAATLGSRSIPPEDIAVRTWVFGRLLPAGIILTGLAALFFIGGFSYAANQDGVSIKLGFLGIPLKHLPFNTIKAVKLVRGFSPLTDFSGYGFRVNPAKRLTGYCLCSGDAVRLETANWSYILVMEEAEGFASVLEQAANAAASA